jgi:predicted xylose isomerase-like sugar epimerase
MRFALNQFTVGDLPFTEFMKVAKRCEVQEVELAELKLATDPNEAAEQIHLLADSGISVCAVVPRVHALFPDTLNPGVQDLADHATALAIDLPGIEVSVLSRKNAGISPMPMWR